LDDDLESTPAKETIQQEEFNEDAIHFPLLKFPSERPRNMKIELNMIPPFVGRCRMGRGGRLVYDRRPLVVRNGIVPSFESDEESFTRVHSIIELYKSGYHPLNAACSDAETLLEQLKESNKNKNNNKLTDSAGS